MYPIGVRGLYGRRRGYYYPPAYVPIVPVSIVPIAVVQAPIVQTPIVQNTVIEHVQQPQAVQTKVIEQHVQHQPQTIVEEEVEHVYLQDPIPRVERRTIIHESSSTNQYKHKYSEKSSRGTSQKTKYIRDKPERSAYDSDDSRKSNEKRKSKMKYRDDEENRESRERSSNRNQRYRSRADSRSRSRSRSHDRHTESRKGSSRNKSPRRNDRHQSSTKQTKNASTNRQVHTHKDDNRAYRSDAHQTEHKVPKPTARMIEAAPKPPPKKEPRQPKTSNSFDPYKALGFQEKREKTDQADIEATFKALRRKWHPDRHMQASKEEQDKATQRMSEINQAYDIIGNPKRRTVYDRTGKTELWELDELVEREEKASVALVRPGKGGSGAGDKPKGLKNIFRKG